MTEADYLAVPRRETRQFKFFRIRSGSETEFTPEDGAKLHFANRDTDTLEMTVPVGFLRKNDSVRVTYRNVTVFLGTLERRVAHRSRGLTESESVTICGPWSKMARLVYRQNWFTGSTFERSSRLILNQTQSGAAQNVSSELREILNHAATACGYTVGTISAGSQTLPFDECRDITVADAVKRELRFFPKSIVSFNYATTKPTINISRPSGSADAAYVADIPKTLRNTPTPSIRSPALILRSRQPARSKAYSTATSPTRRQATRRLETPTAFTRRCASLAQVRRR